MTSNLIKPDLSKDTTGPFVTRDGRKAEYAGPSLCASVFRHTFCIEGQGFFQVTDDGLYIDGADQALDIFLAPKEPKTVFVPWYDAPSLPYPSLETAKAEAKSHGLLGCQAIIQLEVDDQGVPVHNSVVRRVEP